MAIQQTIEWIDVDTLWLDSKNPRLGRHFMASKPTQEQILEQMKEWTLDELAVSFLESGFWTQEALIIVEENKKLVVVEGNRRLAALKLMKLADTGKKVPRKWNELIKGVSKTHLNELFRIPCLRAESRKDIQAYLGFRHVTGIKEWPPAEKAQFIAHLIEDEKLSYEHVMRRIGSKTPTVRRNYIAYRLLLQMEDESESVSVKHVEEKFSVLYLSLRTTGVQSFLGIKMDASPIQAARPVPKSKAQHLGLFARWLFGDDYADPLVPESRDVDDFGRVLESKDALDYLIRTEMPSFSVALRIAGGDEPAVIHDLGRAADALEEALRTVHLHKKSRRVREAADRLGKGTVRLLDLFPDLKRDILSPES